MVCQFIHAGFRHLIDDAQFDGFHHIGERPIHIGYLLIQCLDWERQRDKYERNRKDAANAYVNISTEVSDLQTVIRTKKHPVGTRLSNTELQDAKKQLASKKALKKRTYDTLKFSYNRKTRLDFFIEMLKCHPKLQWVFNSEEVQK